MVARRYWCSGLRHERHAQCGGGIRPLHFNPRGIALVGIEEARRLHETVRPVTFGFSHDTSGDRVLAKGKVEAIGTGYRLLEGDVHVTGDIDGLGLLLSDTQTINPSTVHVDAEHYHEWRDAKDR